MPTSNAATTAWDEVRGEIRRYPQLARISYDEESQTWGIHTLTYYLAGFRTREEARRNLASVKATVRP